MVKECNLQMFSSLLDEVFTGISVSGRNVYWKKYLLEEVSFGRNVSLEEMSFGKSLFRRNVFWK